MLNGSLLGAPLQANIMLSRLADARLSRSRYTATIFYPPPVTTLEVTPLLLPSASEYHRFLRVSFDVSRAKT